MNLQDLIQAAANLTHAERAELLDELIRLDDADTGVTLTPAQQTDLARRIEEYRKGHAAMIPGDAALALLKKGGNE